MRTRPFVAVIQFPGSNCEYETLRVVRDMGMDGRIFRCNQLRQLEETHPQAYILPGGFSFQDRVRAGAVAAKERIMDIVFEAAEEGRPVLGICNGAQVLVESGLVPGWETGRIQASLAANHISGRSGYLSRWIHLRCRPAAIQRSPWMNAADASPIPMPIAHAEGRFVFLNEDLGRIDDVEALAYCDESGMEDSGFPVNPNGSTANLAGIMNTRGNVLAMMPHPERSYWLWQVPPWMPGEWGDRRTEAERSGTLWNAHGPGAVVFRSLALYLEGERNE